MRHIIIACFACIVIATHTGCAICPPGFIDDYGAVGGKWERVNPTHGRVGSTLSDPGSVIGAAEGDVQYDYGEYYDGNVITGSPAYDDGYHEVYDAGTVHMDEAAIYNDPMPYDYAPVSPSDEGVIILGDGT
ncbi:MAG TPA: hypothetical protein DDW52_23625 [Planctomycetaceae bacterium]|nr:hypothetical protein [Planctomycetaceae bacterium]